VFGIRAAALEIRAESAERKKAREAESARFRFKVIATGVLLAISVSLRHFMPTLAIWVAPAVFYGGMILWEVAFSRKEKRECFAHASFWALLFLTSFGTDLIPNQSIWKALTPLVGLAALTFLVWRHTDGIPMQNVESVMEAYRRADYQTALERIGKMDPSFHDRHSRYRLRALIYYRKREFDQAELQLRKGLLEQWNCRKASRLLSLLASVLIEKGQFSEANLALDGAVELDKLNGSVDRIRALVLLRQGIEPERALQYSQTALVASEDEKAAALAVRAWALAENGRQMEARTAIDHALGLPSARFKPEAAEVCYYAGRATFHNGNPIIAERYFLGSIDAEPDGVFGALARTGLRKCQQFNEAAAAPRRRREDTTPAGGQSVTLDSASLEALSAATDPAPNAVDERVEVSR